MKFKSLLAVSLLLFSSKMTENEVQAFRFPADLSLKDKKTFIEKVDRLEKKFKTSKYMRDTVQTVRSFTGSKSEPAEKKVLHGPIVQEHSNNFDGQSGSSGGLIRDSIYGRYFNLQFDYQNAQDFVAGFSYQVFNDLFLYNAEDCTFWTFDSFSDMVNSFLLLVEDNKPDESILSFGYSIHKAPVAYYTCTPLIDDYLMIVSFYNEITKPPAQWGTLVVKIWWNFFFNWADLYYELLSFNNEFEKRNWTMTGTSLAKMFTDLCFKSPVDEAWNYKNSDVINDEWGEPPNLLQGLNDFWMWIGQESFLPEDEMQNQNDKIKDAGDLDLNDPEPQNVNIFDGNNNQNNDNNNNGGNDQQITIKDGDEADAERKKKEEEAAKKKEEEEAAKKKEEEEAAKKKDEENKKPDDPSTPDSRPRVQSSNDASSRQGFNNLLRELIHDSKNAPVAHYMFVQMLAEEPQEVDMRTEKVQRLARCVKHKGAKNQELKRQATAIFKILNHLKNKQSYMRIEPLLDFTLGQYHCV